MACKPEFINEANQALKHQFTQNLKDPYFRVNARGQCLSSPDSKSFTQLWGRLALMFNSRGMFVKMVSATSAEVDSGDVRDHLSHNSRKMQSKIDALAAKITAVKAKVNKALEEKKKLKDLFSPEKMIEVMSKVVSTMNMQSGPKTSKDTQYQGASNYIGRQQQPQLVCGVNGMLQPSVTCFYCKDTGHIKNNCVWLNNKIACELQAQELVATMKKTSRKNSTSPHVTKNNGSSDLGPV